MRSARARQQRRQQPRPGDTPHHRHRPAARPLVAAGMTRIGDRVIVPWREHRNGTRVIGGWHPGTVVATRGHGKHGHAVVISYGYEHDHPLYEIRPYPTRRDGWPH